MSFLKLSSKQEIARQTCIALALAFFLVLQPLIVSAAGFAEPPPISNRQKAHFNIAFTGGDGSGSRCAATGDVSADLSANIPKDWGFLFSGAAAKYNTNPNFLATLYLTEQGNVWKDVTSRDWATSPAGAAGPMQFMPATWAGVKVDGDSDGIADINNAADAIFSAANLISKLGAKASTTLGDIKAPWKPGTFLYIAGSYNWGEGNVRNNTTPTSPLSAGPVETQNYLNNVNTLITSDFTKSGHPSYPDPKAATDTDDSGSAPIGEVDCGGGIGIANGFTFPLKTTQERIKRGVDGSKWCHTNPENCHHDYNAADIFAETGTPIVAAKGGRVVSKTTDDCTNHSTGCNISIMGEDDVLYYYTHMSRNATPSEGSSVSAGEQLGSVGTNTTAVGTTRHLHFDMLPGKEYETRPSCSSEACTSYPFINVQPYLLPAFSKLPAR